MSEARQRRRRRWGVAAGGIGALCSLPALIGALPVSAEEVDPAALRARILASDAPYSGFAESQGTLGLPDLPATGSVSSLLGSRTQLRVWHASPARWRVDVLSTTGEEDTYRTASGTLIWEYERGFIAQLIGEPAVRLPRAADLVPAELGRRLLGGTHGNETLSRLPARRGAGVAAAGLRLTTRDPDTTVDHVDVWADPRSGLPVEVRVTGRDGSAPGLTTRFLELEQGDVPRDVVTPPDPPGAQRIIVEAPQVSDFLDRNSPGGLPRRLAGRAQSALVADQGRALRTYGEGFSTFAATALPDRLGYRAFDVARRADAAAVDLAPGEAMVLRTPLLTLVVVAPIGESGGFVLCGPVRRELLLRAAKELVAASSGPVAGQGTA